MARMELLDELVEIDKREAAQLIPAYILQDYFCHNMSDDDRVYVLKRAVDQARDDVVTSHTAYLYSFDEGVKEAEFRRAESEYRKTKTVFRKLRLWLHWFSAGS